MNRKYSRIKLLNHRAISALITFLYCSFTQALEEESISIVGNNELPSAQFIIPWKNPVSPMIPDRPINSLVNQTLQPVDPDIFRRKIDLYNKAHITD